MRGNKVLLMAVLSVASLSPYSFGQMPEEAPTRVDISELLRAPGNYDGRMVIVRGEVRGGDMEETNQYIYRLRETDSIRDVRVGEPAISAGNLRFLQGQRVVITGIFWDLVSQCQRTGRGVVCFDRRLMEYGAASGNFEREDRRYFIGVIAADLEEDKPLPDKEEELEEEEVPPDLDIAPGELVDLRELVKDPTPYDGKRVSVIGKFRGNNLYSDLSIRTKKTPRDFIIKAADAAIWVTGRRPRGKDFELNPRMRRDTGKWLKVTGVPWIDDGMVYLRAEKLEMVPEPNDPSLEPVDVDEEEEKQLGPPPEVTFSIPLDGERGIPLDTEFQVQFSNDMDPASFNRNVDLLYADDDGTGNPFPDLEIHYESVNRTLVVRPGKNIEPQREIQLILYEGIRDEDGQLLVAAPTELDIPGVAVVLTFVTAAR
jgi:hypothetical protein